MADSRQKVVRLQISLFKPDYRNENDQILCFMKLWDTKVLNYLWDYTGISEVTANEAFCFRQVKMIFKSV